MTQKALFKYWLNRIGNEGERNHNRQLRKLASQIRREKYGDKTNM